MRYLLIPETTSILYMAEAIIVVRSQYRFCCHIPHKGVNAVVLFYFPSTDIHNNVLYKQPYVLGSTSNDGLMETYSSTEHERARITKNEGDIVR